MAVSVHTVVASKFMERLLGLMFRRQPPSFVLVFPGTRAVHTCWMRFPIDIVALDREGRVLEVRNAVPPWRVVVFPKGTWAVAEMAAGDAERMQLNTGTPLLQEYGRKEVSFVDDRKIWLGVLAACLATALFLGAVFYFTFLKRTGPFANLLGLNQKSPAGRLAVRNASPSEARPDLCEAAIGPADAGRMPEQGREIVLRPGQQVAIAVRCKGDVEKIELVMAGGPPFRGVIGGVRADRWDTALGDPLAWTWIGDVPNRPGLSIKFWVFADGELAGGSVTLTIRQ